MLQTKELCANLKLLRKNAQLSYEELSSELKVSITDLRHFELGEKEVPSSVLIKYVNFFNVSLDDLFSSQYSKKIENQRIEKIVNMIDICESRNLDLDDPKNIDLLVSLGQLTIFLNRFDKVKQRKIFSIYKTIIIHDYTSIEIDGLMDLLNIIGINDSNIFSEDEICELFNILKHIVE